MWGQFADREWDLFPLLTLEVSEKRGVVTVVLFVHDLVACTLPYAYTLPLPHVNGPPCQ